MKDLSYIAPTPDTGNWKTRHWAQLVKTHPVIDGIRAWCAYASAHKARWHDGVGQDYVLGPAWARWGMALRELLNGDMGGADCGTLDSIIHDNLIEQGFDP